jgi:hypothetical protein
MIYDDAALERIRDGSGEGDTVTLAKIALMLKAVIAGSNEKKDAEISRLTRERDEAQEKVRRGFDEEQRLARERDKAFRDINALEAKLSAAEKVVEAAWVVTVEANLKTLAHLDTALNAYDALGGKEKP